MLDRLALAGSNFIHFIDRNLPVRDHRVGDYGLTALVDLDGDGKPDIVAAEQEELLPPGRENPRWIIWENLDFLDNLLIRANR